METAEHICNDELADQEEYKNIENRAKTTFNGIYKNQFSHQKKKSLNDFKHKWWFRI